MATVGSQLTAPETGWKRYDDSIIMFTYNGTGWGSGTSTNWYKDTLHYTTTSGESISFKFTGKSLRLIGSFWSGASSNITVSIDGNTGETASLYKSTTQHQSIWYEKTGLAYEEHSVTITLNDANELNLDAIDIDDTGRLLHPDEVTDLKNLAVGKRIRAHYSAPYSGKIGVFSDLGKETYVDGINDFIPPASVAAPNGDFYYIMTDTDHKGDPVLVADRNIQHSISWDSINNRGFVNQSAEEDSIKNIIPNMTSNTLPSGKASSSSNFNTSSEAWMAFSGNYYDNPNGTWWSQDHASGWVDEWLEYEFPSSAAIVSYAIVVRDGGAYAPKDWVFEAFDGVSWVPLDTQTGQISWHNMERRTFAFSNNTLYTRYRIRITAPQDGHTGEVGAAEIEMSDINPSHKLSTRLLTGGTTSTDTDNEWDKYIVNSTLGGTITAGDDVVWHWSQSVGSWSSSTDSTTTSDYRVQRGSDGTTTSVTYWHSDLSADGTASDGFRPVLVAASNGITKYLIEDGTDIKKWDDTLATPAWATVGTAPATEAMFTDHGMDDLTQVTNASIQALVSATPKVLTYSTSETKSSLNYTVVPEPQLIKPTKDISLSNAGSIDYFKLTAATTGGGVLKVIASVDGGTTWKAWDGSLSTPAWITVDATNLADVKGKGMTITVFNGLTTQWNDLRGTSSTIRFAYYIEVADPTDIAETDALDMQIDMQGTWHMAIPGQDYRYAYTSNTNMKVEILGNGDYKINY